MNKTCKICSKKLENRNKTGFCKDHVKNRRTHGMTGTRTYKTWCEMKYRCNIPSCHKYYLYGGRGIKVCENWDSFEGFYKDMGERPDGTSLDRIDNNKGYSPDNCRWATPKQQGSNRRCVRMYKGKNMTDWDIELGFRPGTMRARITVCKWSWEKAVSTPKLKRKRKII